MAEPTSAQAAQPDEARQRVAAAAGRTSRRAAARERDETVFVWPNLLVIEFIASLIMLLTLMILAWLVNAPLEAHANPDRTPNPSKAPWYFLNLQEMLVHMHPALAGVIVPTLALIGIGALPYIDRDTSDVGKWIPQKNAVPIMIFSSIYTATLLIVMILLDEQKVCGMCGLKRFLGMLGASTGLPLDHVAISGWILPTLIMVLPILLLVWLIKRIWHADTRELVIGLFTGFVVTFVVLTIVGTVFRGPGMQLYWPWDMPPRSE
jgi:menaquinol-cytochrome c reductase cytochrome b/c subunit